MSRLISSVYSYGASDRHAEPGERRRMRPVPVPVDALEALQPAARERGLSVTELVQRLLETIGAEKMVAAVLDDAADVEARAERLRR